MSERGWVVVALFALVSVIWHANFRKRTTSERKRKAAEELRAARRRARVRVEPEER